MTTEAAELVVARAPREWLMSGVFLVFLVFLVFRSVNWITQWTQAAPLNRKQ